jgi:translation initiation factor 1
MAKNDPEPPAAAFHNPFGALASNRADLPPGKAPAKSVPAAPARAVVRMERKGRGGKEVTVVEKLELPAKDLERWVKELKQALGCGGAVEGRDLVIQGDQRERVREWLAARGVSKISVG